MFMESSSDSQQPARRSGRVPVASWVGIGAAIVVAGVGALSGGVWMMLLLLAGFVLCTTAYGLLFRRTTWLALPRKRSVAAGGAVVALAVLIGSSSAYGASHPMTPASNGPAATSASPTPVNSSAAKTKTNTPTPTPTPVVTTQLVTETSPVPFPSSTVDSTALPKGTSSVTTAGVNGVETKTYLVTYSNGTETGRVLQSDMVTTQPVTQVTTLGTYVAPAAPAAPAAPTCTNGTYVNSAGSTVCRPEVSAGAPSGATAKCVDGTYSFSQSRRGTCSSHGGVAAWL